MVTHWMQKNLDTLLTNVYMIGIMYITYIYNILQRCTMDIIISNSSGEPIYEQIYTQIRTKIITGELKEGEALPSMRNLAMQLRISIITTKRAYEELERDGFIESYTGKGSFVKAQNSELLREENLRQAEMYLSQACEKAKLSGITLDELTEILAVIYGGNENE